MSTRTWSAALVTGASSGIGAEMARQLGARGTDLVLVARDEARLRALADELTEARPGLQVEVLPADLTTLEGTASVEARLGDHDRPIDLLVNNAGFGASGDLCDLDADRWTDMVTCNVTALVRLTRAALPGMVDRGRGAVLNVSSLTALQPVPGSAVYAATKAFVTSFTESVHEELRGTGVTATTALPGFTRTEFQLRAGHESLTRGIPEVLWQDAGAVAAEALDATARGRALVVCGPLNKLAATLTGPAPRWLKRRASGQVTKRF
jgi:uncharacterized protein